MNKPEICKNCNFWQVPGKWDEDIPGTGNWCSHMGSPAFRKRRSPKDGCFQFSPKSEKAPLWLRLSVNLAVFVMGKITEWAKGRAKKNRDAARRGEKSQ